MHARDHDVAAELRVPREGRRHEHAALPGEREDAYGAGDCFAAALAFALAEGRPPAEALAFAAERGAAALTRRGAGVAPRP